MKLPSWLDRALDLFDEDDPSEPFYDPVHLGAAVLAAIVTVGVLYWLLWTLLVYEGGLFVKIGPALRAAFTSKTLADYGWRGSWDMGLFEGWVGNVCALLAAVALVAALQRAWHERARPRGE